MGKILSHRKKAVFCAICLWKKEQQEIELRIMLTLEGDNEEGILSRLLRNCISPGCVVS